MLLRVRCRVACESLCNSCPIPGSGNDRERIFFTDTDREAFVELLGEVADRFSWICHAHYLMTNHYHLVTEMPNANLSRGMRHLDGVYTQRINRLNKRTGHLLQGRLKAILVEKENYLPELARHVVLNPVRAKMVRSAKDWRWGSYRATAGQAAVPSFLTMKWILTQFGRDMSMATHAYRTFVERGRGVSVWDELRRGNLLGTDSFAEQVTPLLDERRTVIEIPRFERLAAKLPLEELFKNTHDKTTRNDKIHEAMRVYEYTLKELACHLGLHCSTINVIANRVAEEGRQE